MALQQSPTGAEQPRSPNNRRTKSERQPLRAHQLDEFNDCTDEQPCYEIRAQGKWHLERKTKCEGWLECCLERPGAIADESLDVLLPAKAKQRNCSNGPRRHALPTPAPKSVERGEANAKRKADTSKHGASR